MAPRTQNRSLHVLLRLGALVICAALFPRFVSGHRAKSFFQDEPETQRALASEVRAHVDSGVAASAFHTGSARFDGEWAFGTFLMAALGLGQVVLQQPELASTYIPTMEKCAEHLTSAETNAFGTAAWGDFGFDGLPAGRGHAYLGYSNLALSMLRLIHPTTRFAKIHDDLTEGLARRLSAAPHALFETYPGEAYPADISLVAASIALHDCATGDKPRAFWESWKKNFTQWIDPHSGLAFQAGDAQSGRPTAPPRASGSGLVAFAFTFVDKPMAKRLYAGLANARADILGYGGIREYPANFEGSGDIDSGPVVLGVSVSATGFTLASAKLQGDFDLFTHLYRTTDFWGVPMHRTNGMRYLSGGPLGNAILLAMTTATWKWESRCREVKTP
jgi:hypothetical protein